MSLRCWRENKKKWIRHWTQSRYPKWIRRIIYKIPAQWMIIFKIFQIKIWWWFFFETSGGLKKNNFEKWPVGLWRKLDFRDSDPSLNERRISCENSWFRKNSLFSCKIQPMCKQNDNSILIVFVTKYGFDFSNFGNTFLANCFFHLCIKKL